MRQDFRRGGGETDEWDKGKAGRLIVQSMKPVTDPLD